MILHDVGLIFTGTSKTVTTVKDHHSTYNKRTYVQRRVVSKPEPSERTILLRRVKLPIVRQKSKELEDRNQDQEQKLRAKHMPYNSWDAKTPKE